MNATVSNAEVHDAAYGLFLMDLISCLGPTPVAVNCYMIMTGADRAKVRHALELLTRMGVARKETKGCTCYAKA